MKIKSTLLPVMTAATVSMLALLPGTASAIDGTINITGKVTASTCNLNGATAPVTINVALPTVSTAALATAGSVAGRTPFTIALTNCSASMTKAQTYFEPGPTINAASNNLILQGAGVAANVELQLLNADASKILLGNPLATQNSQIGNVTSGSGTLNYFAQYIATGASGAGSANSSVTFTMIYQ
ncbi:fimbrial protein [Undibacterium curvum]|uniref:Type 1 fimbrial protein n=1 Tax=Undibacterium curvum TaxID=2762294 RepID=A0ABR7A421_9BURK|nr:fimbrial protein [Undibacterium curvum]MBC3931668.1 type 1 fimbrial protein [Undibacterium curvum]